MARNNPGAIRRRNDRPACEAIPIVTSLLHAIDSDVSDTVMRALRKQDYKAVLDTSISPWSYTDAYAFAHDYLAASVLSKYPKFPLGIDTAKIGLEKFKIAEGLCRQTNYHLVHSYVAPSIGVSLESYIHTAREKIARLLGDFCWDDAEPFFGFSGGASTRLPRRRGDAYYKFQGKPETTPNCALLAKCAILRIPGWASYLTDQFGPNPDDWIKLVIGSRIDTVPKNAKTDRVIAIEPDLNMFVQRGLGGLLRAKLKHVGINLDTQERNQCLAYLGSIDGSLATLDLSMASDTIALELVRLLLPPDWFEAFCLTRSPRGVMPDGSVIEFEKVSSMGNGFTFELESLIFWALSASVMSYHAGLDRRLAVYGDDIIVPSNCSLVLTELLQHCGFTLNEDKSFMTGPFRESCGKHYFEGVDVTPFYVRRPIDDTVRIFWAANSLRRWTSRSGGLKFTRFQRVHDRKIVPLLPVHLRRPLIPDGMGDMALIGTFDEVCPRLEKPTPIRLDFKTLEEGNRLNSACQRFVISGMVELSRKREIDDTPALLRTLMYAGCGDSEEPHVERSVVSIDGGFIPLSMERPLYRMSKRYTSRWDDAPLWGASLLSK